MPSVLIADGAAAWSRRALARRVAVGRRRKWWSGVARTRSITRVRSIARMVSLAGLSGTFVRPGGPLRVTPREVPGQSTPPGRRRELAQRALSRRPAALAAAGAAQYVGEPDRYRPARHRPDEVGPPGGPVA